MQCLTNGVMWAHNSNTRTTQVAAASVRGTWTECESETLK